MERNHQRGQHQDFTMTADFRVTLLGTGVPIPSPDRFGPSTLVEAGDQKILIDAGRGATIRLYQLNIPIGRIDVQLLTHYHSDHTSCLPDVWLTGWLESHFGTRKRPYQVIGPTGVKRLIENLERAYADDIKIRIADEKLPPSGIATHVSEYERDGLVYEQKGVKVLGGSSLIRSSKHKQWLDNKVQAPLRLEELCPFSATSCRTLRGSFEFASQADLDEGPTGRAVRIRSA